MVRTLRGRPARSATAAAAAAVRRAVETLEPRLFLHAGHDHSVATTFAAAATAAATTRSAAPLIFSAALAAPLKVTATSPLNGAVRVARGGSVTVTFAAAVDPATVNASTFELRDPDNAVVPAIVTYDAATRTATLDPVAAKLAQTNAYFYARVRGGAAGVHNAAGVPLADDLNWSFTTGAPQFSETVVWRDLDHATALRFAPDGRVFVAEKSGIINAFDNVDDPTPTVFADLRTQVHNFWDRGLLGLALSPDFATRPYVYALYTYDGEVGGPPAPKYGTPGSDTDSGGPDPTGAGSPASARLSRFAVLPDGEAGPEQVLIHDWHQVFFTHSIGTVAFGPDGALYVSAGESSNSFYPDHGQEQNPFGDPVNEGGALRSQDLRTPNDPTGLAGTIIRIDPETGAALPTNPLFLTGNDANAKRIIADGLRNPYRMTFRPGTSELWVGDVGNTWHEEINRFQLPADYAWTAGDVRNFGWPAYEGPERQGGFDALDLPLIEDLYAAGPDAVAWPYYSYTREEMVAPGTNEPIGGGSVTGLAFYGGPGGGTSYPAAYDGALFFCDYARQRIWVMYRGPDGLPDPASRQLFWSVSGPVDLQVGPNGDLFYVDHNWGTVRRYQFFANNRPPVANLVADRTTGPAPLTVRFTAANSFDRDPEDVLTYAWDLDGDGAFDDATDAAASFTYDTVGNRTVRVRVTDAAGMSDTAALVVSAGNTAPVATILAPLTTLRWRVGDTIAFAGAALDDQDGALPAGALKWSLILHHDNEGGTGASHEHALNDFEGVAGGSFVAPEHDYPSRVELRLTATDSLGLTHTTSLFLQPMTTTVTVRSNVPGLSVGFNSDLRAGPFSRTVIVGTRNALAAPGPQAVGGVSYAFAGWSDGGAQNHTFVAGEADQTFTAYYAAPLTPGDVIAGLVHRFALDEASGAVVSTDAVRGMTATLRNAVTWDAPRVGTASLSFDGVDDYLQTDADLAPVLGRTATLTAWVRTTQVGNNTAAWAPGITGVEHLGFGDDVFWGWIDASGRIGVQAGGGGGGARSAAAVNDGLWHHVALSRDAATGELKVWVDGVRSGAAVTGGAGPKLTPFDGIGRIGNTAGAPAYFRGSLDEVRLYDRVLTDAEVQAVSQAGVPPPPPPPPASLAIDDVTGLEGNAGLTPFTFTVTRTGDLAGASTVRYATAGGNANPANDYRPASGTLTFAPGEGSKTVTIDVDGDTFVEAENTFFVYLSDPAGATIADAQGLARIVNDDPTAPAALPALSVDGVTRAEGNSGLTEFVFTVTRTGDLSAASTVNYATGGGNANPANDYRPVAGTLAFAPGEDRKTITVQVDGDAFVESENTFFVDLAGAAGATIGKARGAGIIVNDD